MLLLLDNYDSFTYNVWQMLSALNAETEVVRNDACTAEELLAKNYAAIIISPGPGTPKDAGITKELIAKATVPILGICLGHQAIGEVFGGKVIRSAAIVHGKASPLIHNGEGLYKNLPQNMPVGRYHSLIVERETLPDVLQITAELKDGTIMGIRHKTKPIEGIQFHPESILTPNGKDLFKNYLKGLSA